MNARVAFARVESTSPHHDLATVALAGRGLQPLFQPIFSLARTSLYGYEGLIRGPARSPWRDPQDLFAAARRCDLGLPLEIQCARAVVKAFAAGSLEGRIAVNFSGPALTRLLERSHRVLSFLLDAGVDPSRVVIELTEHERIGEPAVLRSRLAPLRAQGVGLALDDFGDGHSSLRLWAELAPDLVKIDKYFVRGIHADGARLQCVQAMIRFADVFGTRLVAEGIEDGADLRVLRDLGIELGQGYFLGRPRAPLG